MTVASSLREGMQRHQIVCLLGEAHFSLDDVPAWRQDYYYSTEEDSETGYTMGLVVNYRLPKGDGRSVELFGELVVEPGDLEIFPIGE